MKRIRVIAAALLLAVLGGSAVAQPFVPVPDIPDHARNATAKVIARTSRGGWAGSGVCFHSESGASYFLTNHHVIGGAASVELVMYDGRRFPCRVIASDPAADLGLLRVDSPAVLSWSNIAETPPQIGARIMQLGYPGEANGRPVERQGYVSGWGRTEQGRWYVECTFSPRGSRPGDSGSPVWFTHDGQICGLVWGGRMDETAAAVPLADIRSFVSRHLGESFLRPRQCPPGSPDCPAGPPPAPPARPADPPAPPGSPPGSPPVSPDVGGLLAGIEGRICGRLEKQEEAIRRAADNAGVPLWLQIVMALVGLYAGGSGGSAAVQGLLAALRAYLAARQQRTAQAMALAMRQIRSESPQGE